MTSAIILIEGAMRDAGILVKSESPAADEAQDALEAMNQIVGMWGNFTGLVNALVWENFPISGGVGEYTIGSGATFNTVRPNVITSAFVRQAGGYDNALQIIPDAAYSDIPDKTSTGRPEVLNYDGGVPTGKIRLFYVPDTSYTLHLQSEKPFTSFPDLATDVSLPPGWDFAIRKNLAKTLCGEYGVPVPEQVKEDSRVSLNSIKTAALRRRSLDYDTRGNGSQNVYTGWWPR
jgi:hypothetical protein